MLTVIAGWLKRPQLALEQPNFKVFIPQHSLMLGQNYVLIYLLLPTNQDYWLQSAMDRLRTEHDETAQKSLLLLLWYAQIIAGQSCTTCDNSWRLERCHSGEKAVA